MINAYVANKATLVVSPHLDLHATRSKGAGMDLNQTFRENEEEQLVVGAGKGRERKLVMDGR